MKKIEKMIDHIKDEIKGAFAYAEKYVIYKNTKPEWARTYADMATDELDHAQELHSMYDEWMTTLSYIPEDDKEAWEHCGAMMAEKVAEVRLLLSK